MRGSGDLKMRLGWDDRSAERRRAGAARRASRRAAFDRAWPHPLPVLQRSRRLGGGTRRQRRRVGAGRRQWRHRKLRRCRCGVCRLARRCGDGRTRRAGAGRGFPASSRAISPPANAKRRRRWPSNSRWPARFTARCLVITASSIGMRRPQASRLGARHRRGQCRRIGGCAQGDAGPRACRKRSGDRAAPARRGVRRVRRRARGPTAPTRLKCVPPQGFACAVGGNCDGDGSTVPLMVTFATYCGPNPPHTLTLHRGMQGRGLQ